MPFIFAMFEVFAIIFTLIAMFALVYKKTRQIILCSLLNVPIDVFYKRIIADKSRPAVFKNYLQMFPWLYQLEANWEAIRDELILLVKNGAGMCNVHTTGGSELNTESKWKLAMILGYGKTIDEVKSFFPVTLSILTKLPEVQNAAFSLLKARGSIPPHCASTASILRYHLALIVPDNGKRSWLTVNGADVPWKEGKGILFDDTFEHSACNGSEKDRVVLIVDIIRPNLGRVDGMIQNLEVWKRTRDFFCGKQS